MEMPIEKIPSLESDPQKRKHAVFRWAEENDRLLGKLESMLKYLSPLKVQTLSN
jgi:hypothetical protein